MADRIYSIDSMRIIAMIFVVAIHTNLFRGIGTYGNVANFIVDSFGRFVVPFFFMASGFFFALKTLNRDSTSYFLKQVTNIASLYVFGLLLAAPVFLAGGTVESDSQSDQMITNSAYELAGFLSPVELFYYGNSVSVILWFLPALIFSLTLVYIFDAINKTKYLIPVSLGFHCIGLLGASYTMFVDVPFEVRDALFFGFFYTSLGYYLYVLDWQPSTERSGLYFAATAFFAVFHVGERYMLGYVLTGDSISHSVYTASYTIGTALFTISLFVFLLSRPNLGKDTSLPSWGKYAVGIYVVHPAILYPVERVDRVLYQIGYDVSNTLFWHLTLTFGTFFGALLVYILARKLGAIKKVQLSLQSPTFSRTNQE
jgi:surface polysaccharide O-acyltransferase-like enzyme